MAKFDQEARAKADAIYAQHRAAMFARWAAEDLMRGDRARAIKHQREAAGHARVAHLILSGLIIGENTYRAVAAHLDEA